MSRTLQKWHGAGNDFLVDVGPSSHGAWWSAARARDVCDRHEGVGADGLMVASLSGDETIMELWNADGSRAETSGNGLRCLVAAVQRATSDRRPERVVTTDAGVRHVSLQLDDVGRGGYGTVEMGVVTLEKPLEGVTGVARVGNPHVVVLDQEVWTNDQREQFAHSWSAQMGGANVEFVRVHDRSRVDMTVVERGVGWTRACGTGSVATAAVLHDRGLVDCLVTVANPGGDLVVELSGDTATLAGPVRHVADLHWDAT